MTSMWKRDPRPLGVAIVSTRPSYGRHCLARQENTMGSPP
jgi:hypothetical protein